MVIPDSASTAITSLRPFGAAVASATRRVLRLWQRSRARTPLLRDARPTGITSDSHRLNRAASRGPFKRRCFNILMNFSKKSRNHTTSAQFLRVAMLPRQASVRGNRNVMMQKPAPSGRRIDKTSRSICFRHDVFPAANRSISQTGGRVRSECTRTQRDAEKISKGIAADRIVARSHGVIAWNRRATGKIHGAKTRTLRAATKIGPTSHYGSRFHHPVGRAAPKPWSCPCTRREVSDRISISRPSSAVGPCGLMRVLGKFDEVCGLCSAPSR